MKTLTLDWNCVIPLEKDEESTKCVERLLRAHNEEELDLAVTAVSAMENLQNKLPLGERFSNLIERLSALSLPTDNIVQAPGVIDASFVDQSYIQGDDDIALTRKLERIISPKYAERKNELTDKNAWNIFCDVHTLQAHMKSGRDIFVTGNTRDFQRKIEALREIGVGRICTPCEVVAELQ